ncbi:hypothetical protein AB0M28_17670 [Streptomyces sp. NPDC051940]|uniref:hypothetical protein n=1 Tax=Streptomyces sp. NPDC051940 TaxID=3155675 RepID=UPI00342AA084
MNATETWTIARISEAIPASVRMQFFAEVNQVPVDGILPVLKKWQRIAEDLTAALERAEELKAREAAAGPPGVRGGPHRGPG